MNRGQRVRGQMLAAILGLVIVIGALVALYIYNYVRIDYAAINHIKELQVSPNHFNDLSGDIGVESVNDLGYKVLGDYNLLIYYGQQVIKVQPNAYRSEDYRRALKEVGIEIFHHVNDDGTILYRVTYWGEPIDEYALVT